MNLWQREQTLIFRNKIIIITYKLILILKNKHSGQHQDFICSFGII